MIDVQELGMLLAQSSMSDEEKEAWMVIIPHMAEESLAKLTALLKDEKKKLDAVQEEYLARVRAVIEQEAE
ncbi:MAG: hypothetical protein ABIA47_03690 [bacterium]